MVDFSICDSCYNLIIVEMLPEDQMRFMLSIFLSIPAGLLLRFIPSTSARKYYSILLATALQYYVYQNELFWALALHVVIYLVLKVRGRQSGFFVTVLSMVTLAVYHTYRLLTNYGSTDIELSFILMLYVSKYSLLAFAYQDGGLSEEKLKHSYQREDRVVELPSFIDFIGYLQFVPTCILNTPVDYTKYDKYIKQEGMFASIPFLDSVKKTVRDLLYGLACGGFYLVQMLYFPVNYMKDPEFFSRGVIFIVAYSFTSICLIKFKYYLAWKLSMLPIHLCGVSYQPTTNGGDQFLGVQTCNPWQIETTIHIREKVNNWNITVQEWLRKCVYDRVPYSKGTAQLVTFAVSAFWHGVYGGYYLSFVFWFSMLYVSGLIFKFSENKEHPLMKLYNSLQPFSFAAAWVVWTFLFTHFGLYFHILQASKGLDVLSYFKYSTVAFVIVLILLFTFVLKPRRKKSKEANVAKDKQATHQE